MRRLHVALLTATLLAVPAADALASDAVDADVAADLRLEPHPSELIEGEDELANSTLVRSGSGTPDDPYIIQDWHITQHHYYGIRLKDTTSHVVIDNVLIDGSKRGAVTTPRQALALFLGIGAFEEESDALDLWNVTNVQVDGVRVFGSGNGIHVLDSENVSVNDGVLGYPRAKDLQPVHNQTRSFPAFAFGVDVGGSSGVTVENVTVRTTFRPFSVVESDNVTLARSTWVGIGPDRAGFSQVTRSDNVSLVQNDHSRAEISLFGRTPTVEFVENRIHDAKHGIETEAAFSAEWVRLCANTFRSISDGEAADFGLDITRIELKGNVFRDNVLGTQVDDSVVRFTAEQNLFVDTTRKGVIAQAQRADIRKNAFVDNGVGARVTGFYEGGSREVDLTDNWWGDASGPNVTGLNVSGPGSGDVLEVASFPGENVSVSWDPWLEQPPVVGPAAVDCGVPGDQQGAVHASPVTAGVWASFEASVASASASGSADVAAGFPG